MPSLDDALREMTDFLVRNATRINELMLAWDQDHNGLVSKKEFRQACTAMGLLFPRQVVDQIFDSFDEDCSGYLNHNELVRHARKIAFARGSMPKSEAREQRASLTRLNAYWERRNRMTVESHEQKAEAAQREAERRHRERLEKEREARLLALNARRAEARQRAVARNEKFWKRREREDAYAEKVRDAWETAYTDQVVFLPQMPEAATMARKTWAREPVRERTPDRDCVRKEIEGLSDVWAGSIVRAWAKPSKESEAAKALKKAGRGAKGKAPQARQFKISPRLPPIV